MTAHVVIELNVTNHEKMLQYAAAAGLTVAKFGGEVVAQGKWHDLASESQLPIGIVIRFEDANVAEAWYSSEEYQALIGLRSEAIACSIRLLG